MKSLINSVKMKLIAKSLVSNGIVQNLELKVGGNRLHIGEINLLNNEVGGKINLNFSKEAGGHLEVSGDHDCKLMVKDLRISGDKGEEFQMEYMELNSIAEAAELFASILK